MRELPLPKTHIGLCHLFALLAVLTLYSPSANAQKYGNREVGPTITRGKTELLLNGAGFRTATWFNVKVYLAALYTVSVKQNPQRILSSPEPKLLKLWFERSVDKETLVEAWEKSFKKNGPQNLTSTTQSAVSDFIKSCTNAKENDVFEYFFDQNAITVTKNGEKQYASKDEGFTNLLLSTWLGKHPPNQSLKEALLGKKD